MTPRQLADRLQLAAGGALRAELGKRLRGSALRMEAAGKQNAKTRMRVRTGHLRNSIGGFVQAEGAPVAGIGPVQSGADILVGVRAGACSFRAPRSSTLASRSAGAPSGLAG